MMKTLCRITGILALALLATQAVRAQEPLIANIPFAFAVRDTTLPPGEYRVERVRDSSPALLIRNTEGKPAVMVITSPASVNEPQAKSKLIFHGYGDHYFLSQMWSAGSARGSELPKSAKEKEHALAAHDGTPDRVTIVACLVSRRL